MSGGQSHNTISGEVEAGGSLGLTGQSASSTLGVQGTETPHLKIKAVEVDGF